MNIERLTTALIPELYCSNIDRSLSFYTEVLGFNVQYQRDEEQFAMLERQGARLMLEQIKQVGRIWLTAPLEVPFGRGINLQIKTTEIDQLYSHIQRYKINLFMPIEDRWYQAGELKIGQRQFIILDPDGYMLRFAEDLGDKI